MDKEHVAISTRAICQRINRKLREKRQILKASRGARARESLGDYHVIDTDKNVLVLTRVNLLAIARKLEVIQPWEVIED